jgi:hypothetical protein
MACIPHMTISERLGVFVTPTFTLPHHTN